MATLRIGDNPGAGTVGGILDAEIAQQYPTSPQGTTVTTYLKANTAGQISRFLMQLDLTPFAGQMVVVSSASVSILNADAMASTRTVELRELITTFTETQATWNVRATATNWNVAGALTGTDAGTTVLGTGIMPTTSSTRFTVSGAGFATWLQGKINAGATSCNFILSVINDTTVFDALNRRIATRNNTTASNRPWCDIDYTVATPPNISVDDISVNNLSGTATFTVSLSTPFALPVSVDYATTDDTATAGDDYTATSGTLTFAPGESVKTVTESIIP